MTQKLSLTITIAVGLMGLLAGCTVHPQGERDERRAAIEAGKSFAKRSDASTRPALPGDPSPDDLVRYALLTNGDVERAYWEWRSAIEQIPQDGTQATNLVLSASLNISRGSAGLGQATAGAGNDPMADIVLPPKLSVAAGRALENARAAGLRFRKAQLALRKKVLDAYYDYALTAELIRLQQSTAQLLRTSAIVTEARNSTSGAVQQDLLKAQNEVDLAVNDIAAMQAQLPVERAALNALLNREPNAPLSIPPRLPPDRKIEFTDERWLELAANRNPEFAALARDIAGRKEAIALAKLQYLPDIAIGAGTDLKGIAQSLLGMVTVPWLRHEAIDAAIAQAEDNLRSSQAMRRQVRSDIVAQAAMDIGALRDADRQLELFEHAIVPRAEQSIVLARAAYETGHHSLLELIDSRRSLIAIDRLVANLRVIRARNLTDLEAITANASNNPDMLTGGVSEATMTPH